MHFAPKPAQILASLYVGLSFAVFIAPNHSASLTERHLNVLRNTSSEVKFPPLQFSYDYQNSPKETLDLAEAFVRRHGFVEKMNAYPSQQAQQLFRRVYSLRPRFINVMGCPSSANIQPMPPPENITLHVAAEGAHLILVVLNGTHVFSEVSSPPRNSGWFLNTTIDGTFFQEGQQKIEVLLFDEAGALAVHELKNSGSSWSFQDWQRIRMLNTQGNTHTSYAKEEGKQIVVTPPEGSNNLANFETGAAASSNWPRATFECALWIRRPERGRLISLGSAKTFVAGSIKSYETSRGT